MLEDGHWPVWIDNPRVDSTAMSRAYEACARPEHRWYGRLRMELHEHNRRHDDASCTAQPSCYLKAKCKDPSCFRCEIKQGGFKFRFMHAMWVSDYERRKAAGAWSPCETEEETLRLDDEWRQRQPEHQRKMWEKMDEYERQLARAGRCLRMHIMNLLAGKENDSR